MQEDYCGAGAYYILLIDTGYGYKGADWSDCAFIQYQSYSSHKDYGLVEYFVTSCGLSWAFVKLLA